MRGRRKLRLLFGSLFLCGLFAACGDTGNADEIERKAGDMAFSDSTEWDHISDMQEKTSVDGGKPENMLSEERLIEEQSFAVELNSLGKVTFASYAPDMEQNPMEDATFVLLKDETVIDTLAGMTVDNVRLGEQFHAVEAVSFPDYNGDGINDIITICSYTPTGGMEELVEARIYTGDAEGNFTLERELSETANAALAEKTVQSVLGFLGAGKSESEPLWDGWQQAYIDYIRTDENYGPESYSLIYLDEDDIPELVRIGGCEADGCRIVSWYDEKVYESQLRRLYFSYIEKENLLCNSEGLMDCYYDIVYRLEKGKLVEVAAGYYGAEDNSNVQFDEAGEPIYQYEWNGKGMSREEYQQEFQKVYDGTKARDGYGWGETYSMEEMTALLEEMK